MTVVAIGQRYLKVEDVMLKYRISRTTIWRWAAEGKFPKPKKFSRTTRWSLEELDEWDQEHGYEASELYEAS